LGSSRFGFVLPESPINLRDEGLEILVRGGARDEFHDFFHAGWEGSIQFRLERGEVPSRFEPLLLEPDDVVVETVAFAHLHVSQSLLGFNLRVRDSKHASELANKFCPSVKGRVCRAVL
jgi:hypothetical protein